MTKINVSSGGASSMHFLYPKPAELDEIIHYMTRASVAPHGASSFQFVIAVSVSLTGTKSITL
jgi:hypothetical protein